jgi:hypothetical protein
MASVSTYLKELQIALGFYFAGTATLSFYDLNGVKRTVTLVEKNYTGALGKLSIGQALELAAAVVVLSAPTATPLDIRLGSIEVEVTVV